jgi:glycerol uptake operon antiterminator
LAPKRTIELLPHLTKPVIPYLTEGIGPNAALISSASVIFIGGGELADLPDLFHALEQGPLARIPALLHIDLISGLANDESGVRYVSTLPRVAGIITVRHHLAPVARKLGLCSVVRLFLQDGRAVDRGLSVVEKSKPDAVEVLPGVAFLEVADRFSHLPIPCIAGGLVRSEELVRRIIRGGCKAVSTTNVKLWTMNSER